jgi:hypothetical protein
VTGFAERRGTCFSQERCVAGASGIKPIVSVSVVDLAELGDETFVGDGTVRVFAQRTDLVPVDIAVQSDADPSSRPDVGGPKEAMRIGCQKLILSPWQRSAPKVREVMLMVTIGPKHHELPAYEKSRRPVAQPFGRAREAETDGADTIFCAGGRHDVEVTGAPGGERTNDRAAAPFVLRMVVRLFSPS